MLKLRGRGWRASNSHFEGNEAHLGLLELTIRLIWTHLDLFRLIKLFGLKWVHLSLFKLISAHASLAKFYIYKTESHSEDAYLYEERELRLINLKALRGSWASIPTQEGPPFFFYWSFEHQFDSSLRTLSEIIGKWVLLMWGVGILWGAVITGETTKWKIRIPMWPTVA